VRQDAIAPDGNGSAIVAVAVLRGDVMNDRQWDMSAYAGLAFVCLVAIIAAAAIVDQLV
jgi:hypothetical protein